MFKLQNTVFAKENVNPNFICVNPLRKYISLLWAVPRQGVCQRRSQRAILVNILEPTTGEDGGDDVLMQVKKVLFFLTVKKVLEIIRQPESSGLPNYLLYSYIDRMIIRLHIMNSFNY